MKPEYLFCSIWEGKSTPTFLALVYRPPDVGIKSDPDLFDSLRLHASNFSHKIIVGDWNANMLTPAETDTRFLTNLMDDLSMQLVPTGSSHHTDNNDTWIDTIFVDSCDNIINSEKSLIPNLPNRHMKNTQKWPAVPICTIAYVMP